MDPRRDVMDDEQFLMDMIASGSNAAGNVEEVGDTSNTDVYLNMSGEGIEQSGDDDGDHQANVYIKTQWSFCLNHIYNQ